MRARLRSLTCRAARDAVAVRSARARVAHHQQLDLRLVVVAARRREQRAKLGIGNRARGAPRPRATPPRRSPRLDRSGSRRAPRAPNRAALPHAPSAGRGDRRSRQQSRDSPSRQPNRRPASPRGPLRSERLRAAAPSRSLRPRPSPAPPRAAASAARPSASRSFAINSCRCARSDTDADDLERAAVVVERRRVVALDEGDVAEIAQRALLAARVVRAHRDRQRLLQVLLGEIELAELVVGLADAPQRAALALRVVDLSLQRERRRERLERLVETGRAFAARRRGCRGRSRDRASELGGNSSRIRSNVAMALTSCPASASSTAMFLSGGRFAGPLARRCAAALPLARNSRARARARPCCSTCSRSCSRRERGR